ncbi:MAG: hypothetical protein R3C97_10575 [Geminicoccaceae bacterium]
MEAELPASPLRPSPRVRRRGRLRRLPANSPALPDHVAAGAGGRDAFDDKAWRERALADGEQHVLDAFLFELACRRFEQFFCQSLAASAM